MIRPAGPQDIRFLRDMLRHAYFWRMGRETEDPVFRYVRNWGRRGDFGLVGLEDGNPVGAAWYRIFRAAEPGFGFVDDATPELTLAVVPARRGQGFGRELLEGLLEHASAQGFDAISLSAPRGATKLYESYGFATHHEADDTVTMLAQLRSRENEGSGDGV